MCQSWWPPPHCKHLVAFCWWKSQCASHNFAVSIYQMVDLKKIYPIILIESENIYCALSIRLSARRCFWIMWIIPKNSIHSQHFLTLSISSDRFSQVLSVNISGVVNYGLRIGLFKINWKLFVSTDVPLIIHLSLHIFLNKSMRKPQFCTFHMSASKSQENLSDDIFISRKYLLRIKLFGFKEKIASKICAKSQITRCAINIFWL